MSQATRYDRRHFIGTAVTAIAGAGLLVSRLGELEAWRRDPSGPVGTTSGTNGSLGPIEQIDTGALNVRYAEAGPANGPPAILLHGGPSGINDNVDVAPLAASGYRVIVPYARGLDTRRVGASAAPSDVMALMAALELEKALVGGVDEGARTAEVMAATWPQRLKAIAPLNGSGMVTLAAHQRPLPPKEELAWWYRYYFLRDERG
jgi:pimeloyl-ACP methyl ester carboxylesterase